MDVFDRTVAGTKHRLLTLLTLTLIATHHRIGAAAEQTTQRPVSFELGTGVEYDSNVAVLELDSSSNAGDNAALFNFGVSYDEPADGRFDLKIGYNFSETLHREFSAFDVRIDRGSLSMSYDLDGVDVGATTQYARAELDGHEFLVLEQISPYVSKLIGKRLFLRFAYARSNKDFADDPQRNAITDSWSSDAYVFLNGLKTYLVFSYRRDVEDALDGQFDYGGDKLRLQLSRRLMLRSRRLTLKMGLRFEARDYDNPTLSIGEPRRDDRYQFEALAELPITERVRMNASYRRADNRSNLPSVAFNENVASISFAARF
jgi:hypothetical protein